MSFLSRSFAPRVAAGRTGIALRCAALPPRLRARLDRQDDEDRAAEVAGLVGSLARWCDADREVVAGFKPDALDTLDYIRVIYTPPLTPSQRMRVRRHVTTMIQENELTNAQVDLLIAVLERLGCV